MQGAYSLLHAPYSFEEIGDMRFNLFSSQIVDWLNG